MKQNVLLISCASIALLIVVAMFYRSSDSQSERSEVTSKAPLIDQIMSPNAPSTDPEHELKKLESDLGKNPAHVPILLRMAQVSRELGKLNDTVRYLRDAVKQDPKNKEALLELGRALYDSGDVEGSIVATRQLIELDPANVDALYNLGAIYGNLNQDGNARVYWEKAVAVGPETESGRRAKESLPKLGTTVQSGQAREYWQKAAVFSSESINPHGGK